MGSLSKAERGKNKGGSGRNRGSSIKKLEWKERRTFSFAFFLGGKTLSKFGEGREQSVEKVLSI